MEIYFDGYCPESFLKEKSVAMRLNEDDFWESEATGLQITAFPPFATILRWRGKGKFRQSSDVASNSLSGLVLAQACQEDGKEIFPDEKNIISNKFALEWYLDEIYKSKEAFDAAKFNPHDPVFDRQAEYLGSIPKEDFAKLIRKFDNFKLQGDTDKLIDNRTFVELRTMLYGLKLIFDFKWMNWHSGWKNIHDNSFDYSGSSMLQLSMYLTAIFRADRFDDISIKESVDSGTLDRIFKAMR